MTLRKCVLSIVLGASCALLLAQTSGEVKYRETVKLDIQMEGMEGMDLKGMLPESQSVQKQLVFDKDASIFMDSKDAEREDVEMESDDGSLKIKISAGSIENILHVDYQDKVITQQTGFMDKPFLIVDAIEKVKWKLTGEKIKYLDYECQKAEAVVEDRNVVAWFTTEIPCKAGPAGYGQLPGLILMVTEDDGKREWKATAVNLGPVAKGTITKPSDGKKVTNEEFEKIMDEKMQEMREQYGEGAIMIRG